MHRAIIAALVAVIAAGLTGAYAATRTIDTTAAVDVTVWQHTETDAIYLSTRPADGTWTTHNTPVTLTPRPDSPWLQGSAIRVDVPVTVEVEGEQTPSPSISATLGENYGGWTYFDGENVDGSFVGYYLSATEHSGFSFDLPPTIYARCEGQDYATGWLFVTTPWLLHGGDFEADVRYRFAGMTTAVTERWWSDEDFDSTVAPISSAFVDQLVNSSGTLFMEFISVWDGDSDSATFDVTGAQEMAAALPC